jgi:hypothetical protein
MAQGALVDQAYLPGEVTLPGESGPRRILDRRCGTVEFWFKPNWPAVHPLDPQAPWSPRHVFLHSGVLRREHPRLFNTAAFVVWHDGPTQSLHFTVRTPDYTGWDVALRLDPQQVARLSERWHHLAAVWDHAAKPDDGLRIYLDGVRSKGRTDVSKPERLPKDKAVELCQIAHAIQLCGLNSGRFGARACLDDLRISRGARYGADFTPPTAPLSPDSRTAALFHFDGGLDGQGMTEQGKVYPLRADAGALEYP